MIMDVENIENYDCKPINGYIGYQVGDGWITNARETYKTMFAYYYYNQDRSSGITDQRLKENKFIGINCAQFSYAEGPFNFSMILGVTGTLDTLTTEQKKIMKEVYLIDSNSFSPSVYDVPRAPEDVIPGVTDQPKEKLGVIVCPDQESYFEAIKGNLKQNLESKNNGTINEEHKTY